MRKVEVIDFDLYVHKNGKGEKREKTLNALKDIYEKYTVLGKHDKNGQTYFIVEGK